MNTILFDLDGTLLQMDVDIFTKHYLKALSQKCAGKMGHENFIKALWDATEYMIKNVDPNKKNMEAFMERFQKNIDVELDEMISVIDDFYKEDFKHLKFTTNPKEVVKNIVNILRDKGYDLVIATNPLFPRQAILHRIEWSGLDEKDFLLITDYENMHYCKPHVEYFKEILSMIGKDPHECIMVGNDVKEDLAAGKLGIKTFLVKDHMINYDNLEPNSDFKGTYEELLNFVEQLPTLKKE